MLVVALLAIDCAVFGSLTGGSVPGVTRAAFFGSLPMANLAAACLAAAVTRLVRRGEVALPLVTFTLVAGAAILGLLAIANLSPLSFHEYLDCTVGFYPGPPPWLRFLLVPAALTPPVLVPALFGGWITRGYRLRLVKASAGDTTQEVDRSTWPR
jgi:hypothetical protein